MVPVSNKKISGGEAATSPTFDHSGRMTSNSPSRLKHFVALLLALIPLAVVVGACVTCP